ncbi:MAG: NAD(P)-dependent oxidoreductase [Bacteroidota bacterium]
MQIAFIGLGIMGSRMAKNLLKNELALTIFNRSPEAISPLVEMGAKRAHSPQDCVKEAEVVFTMLSTPEVVDQLAFGPEGFVAHMKKNALWVDHSTVNPSFSLSCHKRTQEQSIRFLDAPVAGTKPQAENGELVFFVGGRAEDREMAQPYLNMMGRKIIPVGEAGKGSSLKMLVNALLAESMLVFAETLLLGEKMGLDREFLLNMLPELPVSPPYTKAKAAMIKADNYEVQFPLEWMHKDLQLVSQTAYETNQPLLMANLAKEIYAQARNSEAKRLDFAAIYKFLKEKSE